MDPIPNTMSQTYSIVMLAAAKGAQSAQLEIDYGSGSSVIVPLLGDGEVEAKDRETYYACSVGRPKAAWPLVLALGWLARRRRRFAA
jgi:MYXO-CTERM domain-containing protein